MPAPATSRDGERRSRRSRKTAATGTSHTNAWRVRSAAAIAAQASANAPSPAPREYAWMRSRARSANRIARLSVSSVKDVPSTYGERTNSSVSANACQGSSGVARRRSRSSASAIAYEKNTFSRRSFQSSKPTTSPHQAVSRW